MNNTEYRLGLILLAICFIGLILTNCTTIDYNYTDPVTGYEKSLTITTWFKGVEDFNVLRTPDIFAMSIGSTSNDDIFGSIATILQYYANPVGIGP